MGIFDKFKKKNEVVEQKEDQVINEEDNKGNYSLVEMNNYMLSDVRKESLSNNTYRLSLSNLSEISPITVSTANNIKTIMEEHPEIAGWNIISIHGTSMVTMPGIVEQYIDNYKIWMNETFKDSKVYIVSVPPLDEKEWVVKHPDLPPRHNQDIIDFNTKIKEAFPEQYFDYYDWFLAHDTFQDEIHYTGETYRTMFDEIMTNIQNK